MKNVATKNESTNLLEHLKKVVSLRCLSDKNNVCVQVNDWLIENSVFSPRSESWQNISFEKLLSSDSWMTNLCICKPIINGGKVSVETKTVLEIDVSNIQNDTPDPFFIFSQALVKEVYLINITSSKKEVQNLEISWPVCKCEDAKIKACEIKIKASGEGASFVSIKEKLSSGITFCSFDVDVSEKASLELSFLPDSNEGKESIFFRWFTSKVDEESLLNVKGVSAFSAWRREVFRTRLEKKAAFDLRLLPMVYRDSITSLVVDTVHKEKESAGNIMVRGLSSLGGRLIAHVFSEIRPNASGSMVRQELRGLATKEKGHFFLRPHLRILTDDVVCTHAATFGPHSGQALEFLLKRGIPQKEAEELLTKAFLGPILEGFTLEEKEKVQSILKEL